MCAVVEIQQIFPAANLSEGKAEYIINTCFMGQFNNRAASVDFGILIHAAISPHVNIFEIYIYIHTVHKIYVTDYITDVLFYYTHFQLHFIQACYCNTVIWRTAGESNLVACVSPFGVCLIFVAFLCVSL